MMQMMPSREFHTINTVFMHEKDISVNDFQYFLKQFNIVYLKALHIAKRIDVSHFDYSDDEEFHKDINRILSKISPMDSDEYRIYTNKLSSNENDLVICELDKHSPLKIIFGGSIIALVIALILAGGEVETDVDNLTFKAEINKSLGESIQDLRQAFK